MDYPNRTRLEVLGHARILEAREHSDLVAQISEPNVRRSVKRLFFIDVVSFDWNCSQYITPRYTVEEIEAAGCSAQIADRRTRSRSESCLAMEVIAAGAPWRSGKRGNFCGKLL